MIGFILDVTLISLAVVLLMMTWFWFIMPQGDLEDIEAMRVIREDRENMSNDWRGYFPGTCTPERSEHEFTKLRARPKIELCRHCGLKGVGWHGRMHYYFPDIYTQRGETPDERRGA